MKAWVKTRRSPYGEIRVIPDPKPKDDEVLIRVRQASVCGTDVHVWDWNRWANDHIKTVPLVLGHEVSGEVIELGSRVKNLQVGDHISAETHLVDGTCYQCRTGRMHICENVKVLGVDHDGIFAEYAVLPELNAWKNDPNLDPALASIQEPLGNAVHCFLPEESVEDFAGKTVLITGCGPIGLMAILVAKTMGSGTVIATEVNKLRADLAKTMGADIVLNPKELGERTLTAIKEVTHGSGVDIATEMSGYPDSIRLVFDALRPGGRVSLLGLLDNDASLNFNDAIIFRAARVYGIYGRRMFETWHTVKGLLNIPGFREKMGKIITHTLPLGELPQAMELIHDAKAAKVSLIPKW